MWRNFETFFHLDEEQDLKGQHVALCETELCSATPFFLWALQRFPSCHVVCLAETPFVYQQQSRKLGTSLESRHQWHDLTSDPHSGLLYLKDSLQLSQDKGLIVDSLLPLLCCHGTSAVVDVIRDVRRRLGPSATLVTRFPSDCFEPRLLAYEADMIVATKEVATADVHGKVSLTKRGQAKPIEVLYSSSTSDKYEFRLT